MKNTISIAIVILNLFIVNSLFAQTVPLVFAVENRGAGCTVSPGSLATNTKLPDPFEWTSGGRISSFDDWTCRRNEIKADIEEYEIGPKPEKPSNISASYSGGTLTVNVTVNGQTLTLTSNLTIPSGSGPHPVIIGMNSPTGGLSTGLFGGCIQMPFNHDQVVNYNMNSNQYQSDPFYKVYPDLWGKIGNYNAWSWGISRLIDGLEIVKDQVNVDLERIAVTGCSYAGKMALFGGAFDERIALTIVQESGGGGINSWRLSQAFTTRTGTNVEKIDNTNYSWFKSSMRNLNPNMLPHDHHELIAMIAPRAVLIFGNPYQEWLGDESGYKSAMAALEVWKAMEVEDRFGFDFASGHNHCAASTSQSNAATAFINKFLKNQTANTNIKAAPVNPAFDLNYAAAIDWTTPILTPADANAPVVAISSPAANASYNAGTAITITATASDADGSISEVEFFAGTTSLGTDNTSPYSISWTPATKGSYALTAKATDNDNKSTTSAAIAVSITVPQGPYNGTAHAIPGIIQFEEFDEGGNNSAYYDNTEGSEVTPVVNFRTDESVDIETCSDTGNGYNIGYAVSGEWLEYTVNVTTAGTYDLGLRVACNGSGRTLSIMMGSTTIANAVAIPNTGGWQTWETVSIEDIALEAGTQIMRVTIGDEDYVNMNFATFTAVSVVTDNCPNDPDKTEPGLCGCGVPEGTCGVAAISLKQGWNLIGFPHTQGEAVDIALSSVWQYVDVVKDLNGFYDKSQDPYLNSLTALSFGKGYYIYVSQSCSLQW